MKNKYILLCQVRKVLRNTSRIRTRLEQPTVTRVVAVGMLNGNRPRVMVRLTANGDHSKHQRLHAHLDDDKNESPQAPQPEDAALQPTE